MAYITRHALGVAPRLNLGAVYHRVLQASIGRVWENVFDWEHLPGAHESTFSDIELLEQNARGWKIAGARPWRRSDPIVIQLDANRDLGRFCSRILVGVGAGSEIWNLLTPLGDHTGIEVRFYLPIDDEDKLTAVAAAWKRSHASVWNEDEAMMVRREATASWSARPLPAPVPLGPIDELRRRLPLPLEIDGRPFRITEIAGEIVVHSTVCPHWRGPLTDCGDGTARCPWHGYRFDLRTGLSMDGRPARLAPTGTVVVEDGEAVLIPARDVWSRISEAAVE